MRFLLVWIQIQYENYVSILSDGTFIAANGTGSLLFIDDVTAHHNSSKIHLGDICSYSAKFFQTHWTALHSADGLECCPPQGK